MIKSLIKKNELNPKKLFIVDAFGAMLSAFLLGVILVKYEIIFGIPTSTLNFLALLPLFFMVYDFYSLKKEDKKQSKLLKGISIVNISYCLLSLGFAFYHIETITFLGWMYIIVEILIVLFLALVQFNVAAQFTLNISDEY